MDNNNQINVQDIMKEIKKHLDNRVLIPKIEEAVVVNNFDYDFKEEIKVPEKPVFVKQQLSIEENEVKYEIKKDERRYPDMEFVGIAHGTYIIMQNENGMYIIDQHAAKERINYEKFKEELIRLVPDDYGEETITGALVEEGDLVLLVMPQDIQAPKGRLILPQVQTIRDLLDHKCLVMSCTTDKLEDTLAALARPPKLIITDSQVFRTVYDKKPQESLLTSFSVLFAEYKGDFAYYKESAAAISSLTEESKVLIAECCTHAPLKEDIGREKIPNMLRKRIGAGLTVDIVSGTDFPKDLSNYDLIIQCGACMFNKKYVMTRIERAKEQKVPMSNYGVAIAYLSGILDKISY